LQGNNHKIELLAVPLNVDDTKMFHSNIQTKTHLQGRCEINVGLISVGIGPAVKALTQQKTIFHRAFADDHLCFVL
jgi:hypothetical protein